MSDGRIIIDTDIDSSGAEKGVDSLGGKLGGIAKGAAGALGSLAKGATVAIGVATAAAGGLTKASVDQFAQYEQLVGGVETLFKESSGIVSEYADNAYKNAGMSANEYMSTITGFSASLLQGLGGDTAKAAEVGNKAVTDMSDNANKMGTSMESVQNAYQGFAKNNYTMLDNLKLGYGGTKEEMARLLEDAGKLSGMEYDIGNFSDVIEAIHVVQDEMGITGTTAQEASSTIEGSLNMTKSAWTNLLTGISFDDANIEGLVDDLVGSVSSLGENLLPRVETILNNVSELISTLLPQIFDKILPLIMEILPKLAEAGTEIISTLANGIQQNIGAITDAAMAIIPPIIDALMIALPTLINVAIELLKALVNGLKENLPIIVTGAIEIISVLAQALIEMLPTLIDIGLKLIIALALGLAEQLPTLIPQIVQGILDCVTAILDNINLFIDAAIQLIFGLMQGIINALPMLIEQMPMIIDKLITALVENMPKLIEMGIYLLIMLGQGLIQAIPQLLMAIPQIMGSLLNGIASYMSNIISIGSDIVTALGSSISGFGGKMADIGLNLIKGLWEGIINAKDWLLAEISMFADTLFVFFTETIPTWIAAITAWFNELPTNIGYMLGYLLGCFVNGLLAIWNFITVTIPAIITSIITWFSELPGRIMAWLIVTITNIVIWGTQLKASVDEWVSNTINGIIDWFSQLPTRIWEWLVTTITNIVLWLSDMNEKCKQGARDVVNGIIQWFSDLPGNMLDIGKNIITGIWDGIMGAKNWLFDKIGGFCDRIADGFMDALDINSPSRVMRDKVGKFIPQGIGVGMDKEMPNLLSDVDTNMNDLVARMKGTVDYETARTTAGVVASKNKVTGVDTIGDTSKGKNVIENHIHVDVDGKEVAYAVAPHQGILDEYNVGRG